jgi:hypothetical protein
VAPDGITVLWLTQDVTSEVGFARRANHLAGEFRLDLSGRETES